MDHKAYKEYLEVFFDGEDDFRTMLFQDRLAPELSAYLEEAMGEKRYENECEYSFTLKDDPFLHVKVMPHHIEYHEDDEYDEDINPLFLEVTRVLMVIFPKLDDIISFNDTELWVNIEDKSKRGVFEKIIEQYNPDEFELKSSGWYRIWWDEY